MIVYDFLDALDNWNNRSITINNNRMELILSMSINDYMFDEERFAPQIRDIVKETKEATIIAWGEYDNDIFIRIKESING